MPQGITDSSVGITVSGLQRKTETPASPPNSLGGRDLRQTGARGFDDEEGGSLAASSKSRSDPIAECRDRSSSAWLHFPNIELLFLLFAFEGAVASTVGAIREGGCPLVSAVAVIVLVSFKRTPCTQQNHVGFVRVGATVSSGILPHLNVTGDGWLVAAPAARLSPRPPRKVARVLAVNKIYFYK